VNEQRRGLAPARAPHAHSPSNAPASSGTWL
jgi:hypothetical protein